MKKCFIATFVYLNFFRLNLHLQNQQSMNINKHASKIELLSAEGLHKNPAHSQVAMIESHIRIICIGGQNAVYKDGKLVGKGDIKA